MTAYEQLATGLGMVVVIAPALLLLLLGTSSLLGRRLPERVINRAAQTAIVSGLLAAVAVLTLMLLGGSRHVPVDFGSWVAIPGFHFRLKFVFDRLSVPFAILSF